MGYTLLYSDPCPCFYDQQQQLTPCSPRFSSLSHRSEIYDFGDDDLGQGLAARLDESLDAYNDDTFAMGDEVGEWWRGVSWRELVHMS